MTNTASTKQVRSLLDRVAGLDSKEGNARFKPIFRDFMEGLFKVLEKHDVTEDELWSVVNFLAQAGPEFGLIVPGVGLEHFMDIMMDARDAEAGITNLGTPRTIEGPLYVAGAPVTDYEATMSSEEEDGERLIIEGTVRDLDGNAVPNATVELWHANLSGFYSFFDPTESQSPYNNRRTIKANDKGEYRVRTINPKGYSVPPGGFTDQLTQVLGRHGSRPAHVHYFVHADGFRHLTTQINIADDPLVHDDFAFATRDELIPELVRDGGEAKIVFDVELVPSSQGTYQLSSRQRLVV